MNLQQFLDRHDLFEHPFAAEEARHDAVFRRLGRADTTHPDFAKIAGDPAQPAAAVVFGERGSGKTAIRVQLEEHLATHNLANPDQKAFLIVHDDLDPMLERFALGFGLVGTAREAELDAALARLRLADHCDWMVHLAVTKLVDGLLGGREAGDGSDLAHGGLAALRRGPRGVKDQLMMLQSVYDRADADGRRTATLGALINLSGRGAWGALAWVVPLGWMPAIALYAVFTLVFQRPLIGTPGAFDTLTNEGLLVAIAAGVWAMGLLIGAGAWLGSLVEGVRLGGALRSMRRAIRVTPRDPGMVRSSLRQLPARLRRAGALPAEGDDWRRETFAALRRILRPLGYASLIVIVDRVDEPTQVAGRIARMKSIAWPLLNNRFLQQEGIGFKFLLPIELRGEIFRESPDFFRLARLDKQNMVERLEWSGAMLYDLCTARLIACTRHGTPDGQGRGSAGGGGRASLKDLFDDGVTREHLVDALDHMRHPRDAFKMLYRAIQNHCAAVSVEDEQWRIGRRSLDDARRTQVERLQLVR